MFPIEPLYQLSPFHYIVASLMLSMTITGLYHIYKKYTDDNYEKGREKMFNLVMFTYILIVVPLLLIPHYDTVEFAGVEQDEVLEHVEVVDYYKQNHNTMIDVRVDYKNMSRVSITTEDGKLLDSEGFSKGNKLSTFNIGNYIEKSNPESLRIVSLDENGEIINKGRIEIKYEKRKIQQAVWYRW